ncbi:MAG: quinone-dependent dihydroorotate dehydrogenase [Acidithiobacillus sp.]
MGFASWRPWLFLLEPERAHALGLRLLCGLNAMPKTRAQLWPPQAVDPRLAQELWGLHFAHPIGLAAGFDKEGEALISLASMGFAFLELGTVTLRPQGGNPRPRVFRYPQQRAVINRLGFPSRGATAIAASLAALPSLPVPLGINIGKNRETPLAAAVADYRALIRQLGPFADYFSINVSSPNTPDLRRLQHPLSLRPLLQELREERQKLQRQPPLLLKIAPDLEPSEVAALAALAHDPEPLLDGFIATNTTLSRPADWSAPHENGGLSGEPLKVRANRIIAQLYQASGGRLPIIGVGGVFTAEDALAKIEAGASLVQLYTALIYEGPGLIRRITTQLPELLLARGVEKIDALVGTRAAQWAATTV